MNNELKHNGMYAYVINHFGSKIKYLEYEIYTILMLKSISKYDIIYMYSIIDTPKIFVEIIEKMNVKTFGYDDSIIISKSNKFSSIYKHFNTLRTCSFIYSNLITGYKKICLVESDIIFRKEFNNIFKLKTPSVNIYCENYKKCLTNYKSDIQVKKFLDICEKSSPINGGVMLIKPEPKLISELENKLEIVIKHNCNYPNEMLFVLLYNNFYNLPINYNYQKYLKINNINVYACHFASSIYKHIDIIKDKYVDKIKNKYEKENILYFKSNYYDKYNNNVKKIIEKLNLTQNI